MLSVGPGLLLCALSTSIDGGMNWAYHEQDIFSINSFVVGYRADANSFLTTHSPKGITVHKTKQHFWYILLNQDKGVSLKTLNSTILQAFKALIFFKKFTIYIKPNPSKG
jgi:hypothetical protein